MTINSIMLKIAGKDKFELDDTIGIYYISKQCWKYGWMIIRGKIFSMFFRNISKNIFVGAHVKVQQKRNLTVGAKCKLHDNVYIDALSNDGVVFGDDIVIGRGSRIECTGGLQYVGKGVRIGSRSTFGNDCFFGAAGGIEIGEDVVAGQYIRFHSENHNFDDLETLIKEQGVSHKGIKIGNNCWIGSGAVFLDGAEIEEGCVVGANAVVSKKFRKNSIIGGVPARIIKYRGLKADE